MKTYALKTIITYIFEAESDEDAINIAESDFDVVDSGIESEEFEMIVDEDGNVVKDYRWWFMKQTTFNKIIKKH